MKIQRTLKAFVVAVSLAGISLSASGSTIIYDFDWTGPTLSGPNPGTYTMTGWFSYPDDSIGVINETMLEDFYFEVSYGTQLIGSRQLSLAPAIGNERFIFNFDPVSETFPFSGMFDGSDVQRWFEPTFGIGTSVAFRGSSNSQGLHVPTGSFTSVGGSPNSGGYPLNAILHGDGLVVAQIPEPSVAALLVGAAAFILAFRRRTRSR